MQYRESPAPAKAIASAPAGTSFAQRLRLAAWLVTSSAVAGGTVAWLWLLRGPRILDNDRILIGGWIALTCLLLAVAALLKTTPAHAFKLPPRASRRIVLGVCAALHAVALFLLIPALSEDVVRYRLDGRMWLSGFSPYATTPSRFFATHPPDAVDAAVTFPHMHTIYPPTSQLVFTSAAAIERLVPPVPAVNGNWRRILPALPWMHRAVVLRTIFAIASLAGAWLLVKILQSSGQTAWWAVLFAWNPLVIVETAGMGHQDIIGVLLLLGMIWMLHTRRFGAAAAALALAVGVKPIAVVLLPFLYRDSHELGAWRAGRRTLLIFAACAVAIYLPALLYDRGYQGWMESAQVFSRQWEANGSIYELMKHLFGTGDAGQVMERAKSMSRLLGVNALLLAGLLLWQMRATVAEAGYWLLLVLLLVSPVVYPWYLIWVLCFVPMLRGPQGLAGLLLGGMLAMSYVLWHTPQWIMPGGTLLAEYLPVYVVLCCEIVALLARPALARAALTSPPGSAT